MSVLYSDVALPADLAAGGHKVTGLADPGAAQDAATKSYVDSHAGSGGGASGAKVLLWTGTAAAAGTLDAITRNAGSFSGALFQADYDVYEIELIGLTVSTNDQGVNCLVSTNGGASWDASAVYCRGYQYGASNNSTGGGGFVNQTSWAITGNQSVVAGASASGTLKLFAPLSTTVFKQVTATLAWGHTGVDWISIHETFIWKNVAAINALRFAAASGTFSGVIRVYGIAKS
jgi:hypothetical protein